MLTPVLPADPVQGVRNLPERAVLHRLHRFLEHVAPSVRRALAIQLIVNREFGFNRGENPWQGSFALNQLTDAVEEAVYLEFERLSERGHPARIRREASDFGMVPRWTALPRDVAIPLAVYCAARTA